MCIHKKIFILDKYIYNFILFFSPIEQPKLKEGVLYSRFYFVNFKNIFPLQNNYFFNYLIKG